MRVIYKYPIHATTSIRLPTGSKILCAGYKDDKANIWVEQDTDHLIKPTRVVEIFGTGEVIPELEYIYINTYMTGPYVWHVYERANVFSSIGQSIYHRGTEIAVWNGTNLHYKGWVPMPNTVDQFLTKLVGRDWVFYDHNNGQVRQSG